MTDTEDLLQIFKLHTVLGDDPRVNMPLKNAMDIGNELKARDEKIAQLKAELAWLSGQFNGPYLTMSYGHICPNVDKRLCDGYTFKMFCDDCAKCWRQAAKREVLGEKRRERHRQRRQVLA